MAIENLDFRINAAIDAGNSAKTLGELRSSLKDLRDLAAQVGPDNVDAFNKITLAAGDTNDRIKDIRENISALSGTPMERLTNSFGRLRQSIFELDFDKFRQSIIGIKDSFIALGGQAISPFKNLASAMTGLVAGTTSLTAAMRALGGAIAATGIGALVVGVGLLVSYWNDLEGAGGAIGRVFTSVSTTINSALDALKSFAQTLGLIGPSISSMQPGMTPSGQRNLTGVDKDLYEKEKRIHEDRIERIQAQRKLAKEAVDDELRLAKATIANKTDLIKREDELITKRLNQETAYLKQIETEQLRWLQDSFKYNLEYAQKEAALKEKTLKDDRDRILLDIATPRAGESKGVQAERIKRLRKEVGDLQPQINEASKANAQTTALLANLTSMQDELIKFMAGEPSFFQTGYMKYLDDITKEAAKKAAEVRTESQRITKQQQIEESERLQSQTRDAKEQQKRASEIAAAERKRKRTEAEKAADDKAKDDLAATQQLEKNKQRQLDIELEFNRSRDEIDMMYEEISQDRRFKTSEAIYDEIQKRLQWEQDAAFKRLQIEQELNDKMAANKANQFDAENLLISRSQDVFKDYGDFRKKVDEDYAYFAASHAEWTSEQIYEEIFKRYYAQIEAYDAEKQAAINKTNAIIQTAQYGAQALDGINQLVYTLDENRRIAGEMSDKEVAQRAFNRNKAFSIVNAAINTAAGVTAVLASPTNKIDPTGTLQATQIAFVIATGLAQIATITAQKFDASQYNQAPSATTTPSAPEQTVQTGQFANFGDFKPGELEDRRVYVIESDITGVQRKVQVIENRSKF